MRVRAVMIRLIKQILRDKRSLAMLFLAPLLILWLLSLVMNTSATKSTIDLVGAPNALVTQFQKTDATVKQVTLQVAKSDVADQQADGYVQFAGKPQITLEGSDPTKNAAVIRAVQDAFAGLIEQKQLLSVQYLHGGTALTALDYFAPVLIGFFIFFFVFLLSGVAFLRERTGGTLERMLATPLRRYEVVWGYFLGFGIFAVLQTVVVQWFALDVLGVHSVGGFGNVLVVNILLATVALSLGTLLSAFAKNEFQMMQFIPLVILPQAFLSGLFDLRGFPQWLMDVSNVLPLTFAANALRGVMIRGQGLGQLPVPLLGLVSYCIVFLMLNALVLRRFRDA